MKSRKFRVGLIGGGGIAQAVHIPGWKNLPDVEIVGIADVSEATAAKAAAALSEYFSGLLSEQDGGGGQAGGMDGID